jgi:sugar lactone lactonase YvrE
MAASKLSTFMFSQRRKALWVLAVAFLATAATAAQPVRDGAANNPYADFYISNYGGNQIATFNEVTGQPAFQLQLPPGMNFNGPAASQIGFDGDFFVAERGSGQVLRFDGFTGAYKGVFIDKGVGGLTIPSASSFGPDNLMYLGDLATNQVLRYDRNGNFVDVFAGPESGLNGPYMITFDARYMYIASGNNNSVIRYDLKTKAYSTFVQPGDHGLSGPVGLEIGPDGNFYVSSVDGRVLRYDRNGNYVDDFVSAADNHGLSAPRALRFGGPNSDLYILSVNTNQVMQFDRVSGAFIKIVLDANPLGYSLIKGLTFTPRPAFNVYARIVDDIPAPAPDLRFVHVEHSLQDFSDRSPRVELQSIIASDPSLDVKRAVTRMPDSKYDFLMSFANHTGKMQHYTLQYIAINKHDLTKIATTQVDVPPQQ